MPKKLGRRAVLRGLARGVAASVLAVTAGRNVRKPDEAAALEICFWQYQYSICQGGQLKERWCYVCCAGIDCETFTCEWRPGGAC